MSVSVKPQNWVLALFVRDDGERFVLGDGAYEFTDKQQHFSANSIVNDVVEVQGNDGALVAGQVERATAQTFKGYVGDFSTTKAKTEILRRDFIGFFTSRHFFTVVYVFPDGTAIKRQRGYLTGAPEVKEIWQMSPEYSVSLNFEDVSYYEYTETADGVETFSQSAQVGIIDMQNGGLEWDSDGAKWDSDGMIWEDGDGGVRAVNNSSIRAIAPTIEIRAPATNPRIENLTNGTSIEFDGEVASGQVLRIDNVNQTATLNGENVTDLMSGTWLRLNSGQNNVVYFATNNNAPSATLLWSSIVS